MPQNLLTIVAPVNEKLNIELDPTGVWTLRKHSTPRWREYVSYPNGSWLEINGMFGPELVVKDQNGDRCFSVLDWRSQTGGRVQIVKKSVYGSWALTTKPKAAQKVWYGLGYKAGGQFYLAGAETSALLLFTPDQYTLGTPVWIITGRLGPGMGYSGGLVFGMFSGFNSIGELDGFPLNGFDANVALGLKINRALSPDLMILMVDSAKQIKKAGMMSRQNWEYLSNALKTSTSVLTGSLVDDDGPSASVFDLPVSGFGFEVSLFYAWSRVRIAAPAGWERFTPAN